MVEELLASQKYSRVRICQNKVQQYVPRLLVASAEDLSCTTAVVYIQFGPMEDLYTTAVEGTSTRYGPLLALNPCSQYLHTQYFAASLEYWALHAFQSNALTPAPPARVRSTRKDAFISNTHV